MSDDRVAEPACVGTPQDRHEQDPAVQTSSLQNETPEPEATTVRSEPTDVAGTEDKEESVKTIASKWKSTLTAKWNASNPHIRGLWALWIAGLKILSFLVLTALFLDIVVVGFMRIPGYSQLENTAANSSLQDLIDLKRGELLESHLFKRLFEEHPQCLARAITVAHKHYDGLPYQSVQEILDDTVWWANDECNKLMFTPDVPRTVWYRIIRAFTDKAESALSRFRIALGSIFRSNKSPISKETSSNTLMLPSGYQTLRNDRVPAIFRLSSTVTPNVSRISDLVGQVDYNLKESPGTRPAIIEFLTLQVLGGWQLTIIVKFWKELKQGNLSKAFMLSLGWITVRIVKYWFFDLYLQIKKTDYNSIHIAFVTFAIYNIMILSTRFLFRALDTIPILSQVIVKTDGMLFGDFDQIMSEIALEQEEDPTSGSDKQSIDITGTDQHATDGGKNNGSDGSSEPTSVTTSPRLIRIDPNTPFHEDVKQMRSALHGKQAKIESRPESTDLNESIVNNIKEEGSAREPQNESDWTLIPKDGSNSKNSIEASVPDHEHQNAIVRAANDDLED